MAGRWWSVKFVSQTEAWGLIATMSNRDVIGKRPQPLPGRLVDLPRNTATDTR